MAMQESNTFPSPNSEIRVDSNQPLGCSIMTMLLLKKKTKPITKKCFF